MVNHPNIQKEILEYVVEQYDGNTVNLREFAQERGYSEKRVAKKAGETGMLDYGVSIMHPWPRRHEIENVREKLSEWE